MKKTGCLSILVGVLAVVCGVVILNFEERPETIEDVFLQLMILKSRAQYGTNDGLCVSRGTDEYTVSCRHRTFEEIFAIGRVRNTKILKDYGVQAFIDAINQRGIILENRVNAKAIQKYPMIDMYDTKINLPTSIQNECRLQSKLLEVSVSLPASLNRDSFGGPSSRIVVFLHAGGYTFHTSQWAALFRARIAFELDLAVISLNYTLGMNESPSVSTGDVPTFLREGLALLKWLKLERKVSLSNVILIGDSAGGGLAVSLTNYVRTQMDETVRLCVAISPWTEICEYPESRSGYTNADIDPMLDLNATKVVTKLNFLTRDRECFSVATKSMNEMPQKCHSMVVDGCANKYWNPLRLADFTGIETSYLFQAAKGEILRDDAILMHHKLVESGVQSKLIVSDTNLHVLPTVSPFMMEGDRIVKIIFEWIQRQF